MEALKVKHIQVNQAMKQRRRTYRAHGRVNRACPKTSLPPDGCLPVPLDPRAGLTRRRAPRSLHELALPRGDHPGGQGGARGQGGACGAAARAAQVALRRPCAACLTRALPSSLSAQAELGPALTHKQRAQSRTLAIRSGSKSA